MSSTLDTDVLSDSGMPPQALVSRIEISSLAVPKANTAKNITGQQTMGPHAYIYSHAVQNRNGETGWEIVV
jgi:hypothetical protein